MIDKYLVYVVLAFTITAIPGPAVLLTIRNSVRYGFKTSLTGIFGNFIAMVSLATISALGLGAVLLASTTVFGAVKILGAIYLVYLGVKTWRSVLPQLGNFSQSQGPNRGRFVPVFREGVWVGISNPKAIAFFTALFPQFIDPDRVFVPQFLTLILTIEGISCIVLASYALASVNVVKYLSGGRSMGLAHKLTGGAFVGFGIALLAEK